MKRLPLILTIAAVGTVLASCGEKTPEPAEKAPAAPASSGMMAEDMKTMDMAGGTMARGAGTVTAIDKAAGTITLDHGPIADANWPAMEMAFKASPATLLDTVKVGDKVTFELKMAGGTGEVTAIAVQ